jgi:CspA family cold shock protein
MKTGVVKFYNEAKGFGFITEEGTGQDIFVHASGLKEQISENDSVQFEIVDGKKGKNAVEVTVV